MKPHGCEHGLDLFMILFETHLQLNQITFE